MRLFEFDEHIGDWRVLVQSRDIQNRAIQGRHIASGAVTGDKIGDGAVKTRHIEDGAITTPKIADGAVTTPKIAPGAVTKDKIAPGAVDDLRAAFQDLLDNYKPIVINGDVTNAPDEEDITSVDGLLKLKNRSAALSNMGYVILRRNRPFAEQVSLINTIYEVRYDFDLDGDEVTIPENCVLKFEGGSLSNGNIKGSDTYLDISETGVLEVSISGTWTNNTAYIDWWKLDKTVNTTENTLYKSVFSTNIKNIVFDKGYYKFSEAVVTSQKHIIGNDTKWLGCVKDEGHSNLKSFISANGIDEIVVEGIEMVGDTVHDRETGYYTDPLIDLTNINRFRIAESSFRHIRGAYPPEQADEYGYMLINCVSCHSVIIEECEFEDIYSFEWIKVVPDNETYIKPSSVQEAIDINYSDNRMQTDCVFRGNHIYGNHRGATPISALCNNLVIEGNLIEDCQYTGSLFNAHGINVHVRGNIIRDSRYNLIVDNNEGGCYYGQTIIVEDNNIECENAQLVQAWAKNTVIRNNKFRGYSVIATRVYRGTTVEFATESVYNRFVEYFPQNSVVEITGNDFDCSYYNVSHFDSYGNIVSDLSYANMNLVVSRPYGSVIDITCFYSKGDAVTISNNNIYAPYDKKFAYPQAYPGAPVAMFTRKLIRCQSSRNIVIKDNVITGYTFMEGSSVWAEVIEVNVASSSQNVSDELWGEYAVDNISIKGNVFMKLPEPEVYYTPVNNPEAEGVTRKYLTGDSILLINGDTHAGVSKVKNLDIDYTGYNTAIITVNRAYIENLTIPASNFQYRTGDFAAFTINNLYLPKGLLLEGNTYVVGREIINVNVEVGTDIEAYLSETYPVDERNDKIYHVYVGESTVYQAYRWNGSEWVIAKISDESKVIIPTRTCAIPEWDIQSQQSDISSNVEEVDAIEAEIEARRAIDPDADVSDLTAQLEELIVEYLCYQGQIVNFGTPGGTPRMWMLMKGSDKKSTEYLGNYITPEMLAIFNRSGVAARTVVLIGEDYYNPSAAVQHKDEYKAVWMKVSERIEAYKELP